MYALVDCNNFYASCERVFDPSVRDRPVVVLSNNDGCIIARSQEAKELGIEMGQPAFKIEDFLEAHNVAVFSSNYPLYGDMSERVINTLSQFTPNMEVYSIDESFLDLGNFYDTDLESYGWTIKNTVRKWTGIPVSIGIGPTKTLAKVANYFAKESSDQDGMLLLEEEDHIDNYLQQLPVDEVWGIGRQYKKLLKRYEFNTAYDVKHAPDRWIEKHMTVVGKRMVYELRGTPCIPLETVRPDKKGICTAKSFGKLLRSRSKIEEALSTYTARCAEKLRDQQSAGRVVMVFLETNPFREQDQQHFESKTLPLPQPTNDTATLIQYACAGLRKIYRKGYNYKKTGIFVTGIVPEDQIQQNLFHSRNVSRVRNLLQTVDRLNDKLGRDKVYYGIQGRDRDWTLRQERLSNRYTTRWDELPTAKAG